MMKKVMLVSFSVALFLAMAAWVYKPALNKTLSLEVQNGSPNIIPVNVRQLAVRTDTGVPPAEIVNPVALSKAKNQIEQFSCVVKNNTDKNITAITLALTAILDGSGKELSDTNLLTTDTLVHPDIKKERGLKDIHPGASHLMQTPGPISFSEDATIKTIKVEIRCVLFADDTSLGYDFAGISAARIRQIRQGAVKYKEWLKTQGSNLIDSPNSRLIQQVNSNYLPEDEFSNKHFKEGADIYRRWLLKLYKTKGSESVAKYLYDQTK